MQANELTLDQMLTLKQVITGEEPSIASFEVPISYDALTNIGYVSLLANPDRSSPDAIDFASNQETVRATNGNCLIQWNVVIEKPGTYLLRAYLCTRAMKKINDIVKVLGPPLDFVSSNEMQLDGFVSELTDTEAHLYAKVFVSNASNTIDVRSADQGTIKTIRGTTTNGILEERWDLIGDNGQKYANQIFTFAVHLNSTSTNPKNILSTNVYEPPLTK